MEPERPTCAYCGLPFRAPRRPATPGPAYCCSGCAMAGRLGIEGEKFPVTPQLVFDLVLGFGVFNQLLLGLLAAALRREGRADGAARCLAIAVGLGLGLCLAALVWQWRGRWLRASDAFVFALAAGPVAAGVALAWSGHGAAGWGLSTGANLALAIWSARGFLRRRWARRRA